MECNKSRTVVFALILGFTGLASAGAAGQESCPASSSEGGMSGTGGSEGIQLGANTRITVSPDPQNETTIAVDPTNPLNVVMAFNDYRLGGGFPGQGVAVSSDGGETWSDLGLAISLPAGFTLRGGDPGVAFDSGGRVFCSHVAASAGGTFQRNNGVFVASSTTGGLTWSPTVAVASNLWPGSGFVLLEDKPLIAADGNPASPFADRVYVSWTRFYGATMPHPNPDDMSMAQTFGGGDILFSYSDDHGATWSAPYQVTNAAQQPLNHGTGANFSFVSGSEPEVASNGDVYVAYWFGGRIEVHRSTDGGVSFLPPTRPFGTTFDVAFVASTLPAETFRINAFPNIETDATRPGNVYVVAADDPDGGGPDGGDIVFARSTDDGASWSSTVTLNDDGLGNNQIFPWMAVDDDTGDICVIWYDTRDDPANHDLAVYGAFSFDGGVTWSANMLLTEVAFDPDTAQFPGNSFIGDYNGIAAGGGIFHAAWTDMRTGDQEVFHCSKTTDLTAPLVTITSPADGTILGTTSVEVFADVSDATATEVVSTPAGVSGALGAGGGSVSGFVPLVEGENVIAVCATDVPGNVGGSSITVVRDTLAPSVSVLSPAFGAVLGMSPASLTVHVTDATETTLDVGGNVFVLPEGGGTVAADVPLVEGTNTITVSATDAAGNVTTVLHDLVLDLTAPIVTIDSPADGSCYGPGDSPVAVSATVDDLSQTSVDSTPVGVAGNLPAGGGIVAGAVDLVEGSNTIQVSATDETGRNGSDSITVVLDTTAPLVSLVSPGDGDVVRGTVDFDATAADPLPGSGVAHVDFQVDSASIGTLALPPYELSLDTTTLADGGRTLSVVATDGKGNAETASVSVVVDNTPPGVSIMDLADGDVVSGTIGFMTSATDATSGIASIQILANSSAPNAVDGSESYAMPVSTTSVFSEIDTTILLDGPLTICATATDAAGNTSSTEIVVTVDNLAPTKTLVTPTNGSVVSGVIDIVAEAEDANLDLITIYVDGQEVASSGVSPLSTLFDTTTLIDCTIDITVVVTDLGANLSSCTTSVVVDNMSVSLTPRTLNLKSKGKERSVAAHLEGPNLGLLLPVGDHDVHLEVPGASPIAVTPANYAVSEDQLDLHFDRQQLIAAINAGIASEMIQDGMVEIALVVDGCEIGTDVIRYRGGPRLAPPPGP